MKRREFLKAAGIAAMAPVLSLGSVNFGEKEYATGGVVHPERARNTNDSPGEVVIPFYKYTLEGPLCLSQNQPDWRSGLGFKTCEEFRVGEVLRIESDPPNTGTLPDGEYQIVRVDEDWLKCS